MSSGPGRNLYITLALVLFSAVALRGLGTVGASSHPTGWDGYYYLVQVKSLVSEGEMHSPEYSPVYLPLLAFYGITGDYLASYRLSSVLILLLFVMSMFSVSLELVRASGGSGREAVFCALLAAGLSAVSPSLNFYFTQFPKNLLGLAFFLFFAAWAVALRRRISRKDRNTGPGSMVLRLGGGLLLFLAAFFTHRFSAVLSLIFLLFFFAPDCMVLFRLLMKKGGRSARVAAAAVLALFLLILVLSVSGRIPLAPSIRDLQRITGDVSSTPILVPLAFVNTFGAFRLTTPWLVEVFLASLLPVVTLLILLFGGRSCRLYMGRGHFVLLAISLIGLFPFLEFSLTGLSYRLLLATLLMFPVVCLPWIRMAVARLQENDWKGTLGASLGVTALALVSVFDAGSYRPELHDPPYGYYLELSDGIMEALSGREAELIVAHRSLAEVITFRHGADALPWSPEERFRRERVWRVTAGIMRSEFRYYLAPVGMDTLFMPIQGDYCLLREDAWEAFMDSIADEPAMMQAAETWRNPLERRPAYLVGEQ